MGKVLEAAARSKMARVPNVGGWEVPRKLRASAVTFGVRDQGGAEREWNGQTSLLGGIMWRCRPGPKRPIRKERARRQ